MNAAVRLKRLRLEANPPLSIRGMAERLGLDHSTYVRYERPERFKKLRLPIDLARRIAGVLSDHGIEPDRVMELAGLGGDESVDLGLTPSQEKFLLLHDAMTPDQRRLIEQLAEQIIGRKPADVINQEQNRYRVEGLGLEGRGA